MKRVRSIHIVLIALFILSMTVSICSAYQKLDPNMITVLKSEILNTPQDGTYFVQTLRNDSNGQISDLIINCVYLDERNIQIGNGSFYAKDIAPGRMVQARFSPNLAPGTKQVQVTTIEAWVK